MADPPYGPHLTTIGFNTSTEACRSSQCLDCSLEGAIRFQVLDEIESVEEDSIQWGTTTSTWTLFAPLWRDYNDCWYACRSWIAKWYQLQRLDATRSCVIRLAFAIVPSKHLLVQVVREQPQLVPHSSALLQVK